MDGLLRRPILAEELLIKPQHSIIDQILHSRLGVTTTNGDGFGIGWYGEGSEPALFKSIEPAWDDRNLREVAGRYAPQCSLPTFAHRPVRQCSTPTATHSAMAMDA
jgi:predicted glutamine amidotransferase